MNHLFEERVILGTRVFSAASIVIINKKPFDVLHDRKEFVKFFKDVVDKTQAFVDSVFGTEGFEDVVTAALKKAATQYYRLGWRDSDMGNRLRIGPDSANLGGLQLATRTEKPVTVDESFQGWLHIPRNGTKIHARVPGPGGINT